MAIHFLQVVHLIQRSCTQQKNKLDCYRGKDCMEKFYKDLREHAMGVVNYEKKKCYC